MLEPKEFVLYERGFYFDGLNGLVRPAVPPPPPLDTDLRHLPADPLDDWTAQASAEPAKKQRLAAKKKALRMRRDLWRLENDATSVGCPACGAGPGLACLPGPRRPRRGHDERGDAALAGSEPGS
ncbi:hypothetical protein [Kitasatospora kazusensis]|uniref:hypothetical protein n=1 Tax=Kitasatospora kazusensis TaxID=407974 RepID=UPI0031D273D8